MPLFLANINIRSVALINESTATSQVTNLKYNHSFLENVTFIKLQLLAINA